jgi:fatty aldehyde-generating acyl-ACP reductase
VTIPAPRTTPSPPTPADPVEFAFLVHPRTEVSEDVGKVWRPLGLLPSSAYEKAFGRFRIPAFSMATASLAHAPDETVGRILFVSLTPRQLLTEPRLAADRITAAVDSAVARGIGILGLGALTAPATQGGALFRDRTDIGITNGNAFTAAVTAESVLRAHASAPRPGIALVGASGSVGSAVARLLARAGVPDLLLVGRTPATLGALARDLEDLGPGAVRTSVDIGDVRTAGLVVLLTSATEALLRSEHLGPNTVVIDDTQPRNTSPDLLLERPDVVVLDGGIVETPGVLRRGGSIGLPRTQSYACLAETTLLGLAGHRGHGTLGRPSLPEVDRLIRLSARFAHLGFSLAAPTSFGAPVEREFWRTSDPAFSLLAPSVPSLRVDPVVETVAS